MDPFEFRCIVGGTIIARVRKGKDFRAQSDVSDYGAG